MEESLVQPENMLLMSSTCDVSIRERSIEERFEQSENMFAIETTFEVLRPEKSMEERALQL